MMLALPAIDLRRGKCVRLRQGRAEEETVHREDPSAVAREFAAAGAGGLHVVDLDGAFLAEGGSPNRAAIAAIRRAVELPLQVGGGLRSAEAIAAMLALGVEEVIVTTFAIRDAAGFARVLAAHAGRIQLGVDAREGRVAAAGWLEDTGQEAQAFARHWGGLGIERVVFTDIARDGMLRGPNLEAVRALAEATGLRVTASGGVRNEADLEALAALEPLGVERAIIGQALYTGGLPLEALGRFSGPAGGPAAGPAGGAARAAGAGALGRGGGRT